MAANPFTTIFGGNPASFFGRKAILRDFHAALQVPGSGYRALFLTGTRGSGKTCLLEQLSSLAHAAHWETIDLVAEGALWSLYRTLAPYDEVIETHTPTIGAQVFGVGGSFGARGSTKKKTQLPSDLVNLFVEHCQSAHHGVFVTLDEIQKVPLDDVSLLCSTFQMASRKGCNVALAVAGLPFSHERVILHDGCTFMRRAQHLIVDLFTRKEVREAYTKIFGAPEHPLASEPALNAMIEDTRGQPYLMQLIGYYAFEIATNAAHDEGSGRYLLNRADVDLAFTVARQLYTRLSLVPLLQEARPSGVAYLRAMVQNLNEHHVATTASIAQTLGKTPSQLSKVREFLMGQGIIIAAGHGLLRFGIPYLREYLLEDHPASSELALSESWDV